MIRKKLVADTVASLLNSYGVTRPPVDIKGLAEAQGAIVIEEPNEEKTSGFLFRAHGTPPVIGVNACHPPTRKRFTVAHELAHLMLHSKEGVHVDYAVIKMRDATTSAGTDEEEIEANRFAAEILMPLAFLEQDILKLRQSTLDDEKTIVDLAKMYGVSSQAMAIRLTSLNLISM